MLEAVKALTKMMTGWYGRLEDITEELTDMGFEVEEANREYITVWREIDGEDKEFLLYLGGTEHTITVDDIKEV